MESLLRKFKALSDKSRLRILKLLQVKSLCVCEITDILGHSTPTVSNHLAVLVNAGFLRSEKEGRWVYYHLVNFPNSAEAASLLPLLQYWMNEDAQIQSDREMLKTVCREEIHRK